MLWRANVVMPLMREGEAVGVIGLRRTEPVAFSETQIQLLKTFADQAVIAIENVRLFDEVQARTKDLQEALQQQTATTNVLKVISRSAFDWDAVLKTLTDSARSLSGAATAAVFLRDGDVYPVRAEFRGLAPEFLEYLNALSSSPRQDYPHRTRCDDRGVGAGSPTCARTPTTTMAPGPQVGATIAHSVRRAPDSRRQGGRRFRALLLSPAQGVLAAPQMEMVLSFRRPGCHCDRERAPLRRSTGPDARPHGIARSSRRRPAKSFPRSSRAPRLDVQPVFDAIAHSAAGLCEATNGGVDLYYDGLVHLAAHYNWSPDGACTRCERIVSGPRQDGGFAVARAQF